MISQIAQSGARFAVTTGDNAYEIGSQKSYGDLYQVGDNTSAVFGPNYWTVAGASLPLFPALGNHDYNNSVMLTNWPQDTAVSTSAGRYQTDTYCCTNGTTPMRLPQHLVRLRRRPRALLRPHDRLGRLEPRHRHGVPERLRQPLGPKLRAVPVARERPRDPSPVAALRLLALPARIGLQRGRPGHLPPGAKLAGGAAEAVRRDGGLQRPLAQLPAQHRAVRRHPDAHHRRRRREPRSRSGPLPAAARSDAYGVGWSNTVERGQRVRHRADSR